MAHLCFSCQNLVSLESQKCHHCGTPYPALFGFSKKLKDNGISLFVDIVIWGCFSLYAATLLTDISHIRYDSLWNFLSPSLKSLLSWGATGAIALREGRWWTILSCAWLHGSILHILFNLLWIRELAPTVGKLYRSAAKLVIIYTISAVFGGLISTTFNGAISVGASGAIFGLFGALLSYAQKHKNKVLENQSIAFLVIGVIWGFTLPQIDNWGHFGGFLGGFTVTQLPWLKSGYRDNWSHLGIAIACLLLSLLSIVLSITHRVDWSPYLQ